MNNKQGFTLGEIAITIAVVGFLAAMFLPMIKNAIPNQGRQYEGTTKFCELFAMRLNKASDVDCKAKTFTNGANPVGTLTAADGIVWILPVSNFANETTAEKIYLDVNGNKKPNCFYDKDKCKTPDRFTIKVYQDGRVEADGTMEIEYLNNRSFFQRLFNKQK